MVKFNVDEDADADDDDDDDDDERSAASSIELQGIDSAEPTVIQATRPIKKRRRHELRRIMLSFSPPKERIIYKCREKIYSLDRVCF